MADGGVRRRACARCQRQRKRCQEDCMFALYFPAGQRESFPNVHKIFSANNVTRILQELPEDQRAHAMRSMVYEANARVRDPVYGCFGEIMALRGQVADQTAELARLRVLVGADQSNHNPSQASLSHSELPF